MTTTQDHKIIKQLLSELAEIFWEKPDMFFNESNIHSEVYLKFKRFFGKETKFSNPGLRNKEK